GVIAIVSLVVRFLAAHMRASGEGKDLLVAELEQRRLQAEDILRNIRSGVITIDSTGKLLYANPMAEHLLGIQLIRRIDEPILDIIAGAGPELSYAIKRAAESKIRTTRGEGVVTTLARRFPVGVTTTYTEHEDGSLTAT